MPANASRAGEGKSMQRKYFGTTSDGIPVHIFHLESQSGVAVRVMEYGASLVSIETPDRYELSGYLGADSPLGSAPNASVNSSLNSSLSSSLNSSLSSSLNSSLSSSLNSSLSSSLNSSLNTGRAPACGATLGRYAGRIGDGAFRLSGSLHTVSKDDGSDRPGAGAAGLHRAVWWGEALSEGVRFHYRTAARPERRAIPAHSIAASNTDSVRRENFVSTIARRPMPQRCST